jgi:hypothetical protein
VVRPLPLPRPCFLHVFLSFTALYPPCPWPPSQTWSTAMFVSPLVPLWLLLFLEIHFSTRSSRACLCSFFKSQLKHHLLIKDIPGHLAKVTLTQSLYNPAFLFV